MAQTKSPGDDENIVQIARVVLYLHIALQVPLSIT